MINLLSDERKAEIRAARTNVIIVRYTGIIAMAIVFILSTLYVSYTVLQNTMASAETQISANDVKADIYSETKQQVDTLSAKLAEAKTILDQEIRYSRVLVNIGQQMPSGTVLGDVTLSAASFSGTPVELKAYAKSTTEAGELKTRFQASPLFSQVNLLSTDENAGIDGYPVSVSMTVVFNRAGLTSGTF